MDFVHYVTHWQFDHLLKTRFWNPPLLGSDQEEDLLEVRARVKELLDEHFAHKSTPASHKDTLSLVEGVHVTLALIGHRFFVFRDLVSY